MLGIPGDIEPCETCALGEMKHTRFKSKVSNVERPLERLHSEVMDPLIEGIFGEKYCLLFIDEMSRKACIRVM